MIGSRVVRGAMAGAYWMVLPFLSYAAELAPMGSYTQRVAGSDDHGFKDGAFYEARFDHPVGMAFDTKGNRLFVADRDNHRVRVIQLDDRDRVRTVAGTGVKGKTDGSLDKAQFDSPTLVAYLPGDQLVVFDHGDHLLRLVDLPSSKVRTLLGDKTGEALSDIWDMVYRPQDNSLYFSEPTSHTLRRLGLATGKLETLFFNDPRIPAPAALCLEGDKLDLSDLNLPVVFRADPSKPLPAKGQTFPLEQAGKGCRVDRLVVSDGILYGLGMGDNPLVRIGTDACTPVTLASPWGFQLANDVVNLQPFLTVDRERPMGLAADPGRPRQLFVSSPLSFIHTIVAVKDYDFGTYWTARSRSPGVPDFNYPHVKSSKTFRILVLGDSRVVSAFQFPTDPKTAVGTPSEQILHSPRVLTFPKRLEFLLNTQAALEGSDTRFEVICEGKPGEPTSYLSRYEGPRLAKTFDVDLVFNFEVPFATETYDYYVDRPLTKEGIPQEDMDAEFRVKPFDQRVPTAGASRDLYDRWRKPGLPGAAGPLTAPPRLDELLRVHDPGVDQDLTEMLGKPLRLLAEDLHSLRTSGGKQVGFFLCFAPSRDGGNAPVEDYRGFWRGLCAQKGIAFMDLTDGYNALADSFFPSLDSCCHGHFNAYGNELLATLIGRELSARKWVPTAASGDRQSP